MKKNYFYLATLVILMSSCIVFNSGNVSSGPLLSVNDKYVDIAIGESESITVIGMAWEYSNKMVLEAKAEMFKNRPLRNGEYYSNFTCDFSKKIILGIIYTTRVTVSAEVLRIKDSGQVDRPGVSIKPVEKGFNNAVGLYHPKNYFINKIDSFVLGERIFYSSSNADFKMFEITAIDSLKIGLKRVYGIHPIKYLKAHQIIYSTKKQLAGFKVGERVLAIPLFEWKEATIVAASDKKILLRSANNYFLCLPSDVKKKL
jgi:hypothetical protein